MTYLIDTSVLLWALEDNSELSPKAKSVIINRGNDIYVSIASLWEIAIKMSIGKLTLSRTLDEIIDEMDFLGFTLKPASVDAIRIIRNMPFHHRDPFDRLILAQAQAEGITVIAKDHKFKLYGVDLLW